MRELIERRVKGFLEFERDYGKPFDDPIPKSDKPIKELTDQELLDYFERVLDNMNGVQE